MYAITGATGNTGKLIVEALLAKGKKVRVIGRSAERLQSLVDKGADAFVGSVDDIAAMTRALTEVKAIYAMIPPNYRAENYRAYQNKVGEALATAIKNTGVQYVVNLSSVGAHLSEKVGPVKGLYDQEQRLNKLEGVSVVHLRPCYFMENLLPNVSLIKQMSINGGPLKADVSFPMIATRDIAPVATQLLLDLNFSGKSAKELLGQRNISTAEVTQIIGRAIGKEDLQYVQFPYEDAEKAMVNAGLSPDMAKELIELDRGINEGILVPTEPRSATNTTPTSFEEFATQIFAVIYNG
ncbi:MAG: NmrA family NAD(P)-binding protein [Nitrososphaera sp.]|nr:NmrA family NAD(P)-binding protein [Nitrososphaera sp.]